MITLVFLLILIFSVQNKEYEDDTTVRHKNKYKKTNKEMVFYILADFGCINPSKLLYLM